MTEILCTSCGKDITTGVICQGFECTSCFEKLLQEAYCECGHKKTLHHNRRDTNCRICDCRKYSMVEKDEFEYQVDTYDENYPYRENSIW